MSQNHEKKESEFKFLLKLDNMKESNGNTKLILHAKEETSIDTKDNQSNEKQNSNKKKR